jgi:GntR family transcriptional regulator, transcriptional repressor for pyruvate dehydrogenase complex
VKAAERVARTIAGELLDGEFPDGSMLPNEVEMSQRYGVGRSTVREALRILEGWGAVRMKQGRNGGPVATRPDIRSVGDHLGIVMQFEGVTLADIFETRRVLDTLLAGLAASTMSDNDVLALGQTIQGMSDNIDNIDKYVAHNNRFYEVLIAASGNRSLQILIGSIQSWTSALMFAIGVPREWREKSVTLRSALFRAIASRDVDEAERQMNEYRTTLQQWWAEHYPAEIGRPIDVIGWRGDPPQR